MFLNEITLSLAMVDLIPVLLYIAAGVLLLIDFSKDIKKWNLAICAIGFGGVSFAGILKVIWKFHQVWELNIDWIDKSFFGIQSISYVILAVGALIFACTYKKEDKATKVMSIAPLTLAFISIQLVGCIGFMVALMLLTKRQHKLRWLSILLFCVSLVFMLCMGYLGSKFDDTNSMHWTAQLTNICGNSCLLAGLLVTHFTMKKSEEPAKEENKD